MIDLNSISDLNVAVRKCEENAGTSKDSKHFKDWDDMAKKLEVIIDNMKRRAI